MSRTDEGFTLAETLMALVVVSLALAAIMAASHLIVAASRRAAAQHAAARMADDFMNKVRFALPNDGPLIDAVGDRRGFSFDCGGTRCRFVAPSSHYHLAYAADGVLHQTWPAGDGDALLEALILQDDSRRAVGVVHMETEQSSTCQFDMISRVCRQADAGGTGEVTP